MFDNITSTCDNVYSEKTKEVIMELGTKIIGDFGGYEPLLEGEVVTISTYNTGPTTPEVKVNWDNGSHTWVLMSEIDAWGKKSKIGYYTEDGYYG